MIRLNVGVKFSEKLLHKQKFPILYIKYFKRQQFTPTPTEQVGPGIQATPTQATPEAK